MANTKKFAVKNGLLTQNISFLSPDETKNIDASMLDSGTVSFSGTSGQLFSITDSMTGVIFAVNDISGVPSIEVDDNGTIRFAELFGNVLIGTNVDNGSKLQVNGNISVTGTVTAPTFSGALSGNAATATTLQTTRTIWGQNFNGSANVTGNLTSVGNITGTGAVTLTATSGTLSLIATGANIATISTNGSERVRVTSAGDVGIGTSSPLSRLEVATNSNVNGLTVGNRGSNSSNALVYLSTSSIGSGMSMAAGDGIDLRMPSSENAVRTALSAESYGGNTGSSWANIQILLGSSNSSTSRRAAIVYIGADNAITFRTGATSGHTAQTLSGTERMRITSGGDVGIGTTSPGAKAEIYVQRTSSTNAVALILNDNVTGAQTNGVYKAIRSLSNAGASVSEIRFVEDDGTNNNTSIAFATAPTAGGITERARITRDGALLVGTTSNPNNYRAIVEGDVGLRTSNDTTGSTTLRLGSSLSMPQGIASIAGVKTAVGGGYLTLSSASGGTLAERIRILENGNVGIGTTAPTSTLQVGTKTSAVNANISTIFTSGAASASGGIVTAATFNNTVAEANNNEVRITFSPASNYSATGSIGTLIENTTGALSAMRFSTYSAGALTERMRITSGGNVGIGTNSPATRLQIGSTTPASTATPETISIGGTFSNTAGANAKLRIWTDGTQVMGLGVSSNQLDYIASSAYSHVFYTNAAERLRITAGGNVGIGTNSPDIRLHSDISKVSGNYLGDADVYSLGIRNSNTSNGNAIGMAFGHGTSSFTNFIASVRTTAGAIPAGDLVFGGRPSDNAGFIERVRITAGGNVGIGTTNPGYRLEVNGSFAATTKSFIIDHPTKPGMKLRYGSLESPYHGVRLTGESKIIGNICRINLPEYIHGLCKQEGAQVQLTNIKHGKVLWVEEINVNENYFEISCDQDDNNQREYKFYWSFTAIRKDIEELIVEINNE